MHHTAGDARASLVKPPHLSLWVQGEGKQQDLPCPTPQISCQQRERGTQKDKMNSK